MLGTSSGLCILVKKNRFMFQEGTNRLYFYAKFEVLTFNGYGDVKQNGVKTSVRHRILHEIPS